MRQIRVILGIVSLGIGIYAPSCLLAQTFECDGSLYITTIPNAATYSALYRLQVDLDTKSVITEEINDNLGYRIKPIGYRVQDNYLYGLDQDSLKLLRIDNTGNVTELTRLEGLWEGYDYLAGDVSPSGNVMFLIGRDQETGIDRIVHTVQLQPPYRIGINSVVSRDDSQIDDIAYDPIYGSINGFDNLTQRLVILTRNGNITNYFAREEGQINGMGAMFFDKSGNLLSLGRGLGNERLDNRLFSINKFTGASTRLRDIDTGYLTAGCSCPYSVTLRKAISPNEVTPCDTIRLVYHTDNRAGVGQPSLTLRDTLPEGVSIASIERLPFLATLADTYQEGIIDLSLREMVLNKDSAIFVLEVEPGTATNWETRAVLSPLSVGLGERVYSAQAILPDAVDPTALAVTSLSMNVHDVQSLCFDEPTTLAVEVSPATTPVDIMWNTGATSPEIEVSEAGWYNVQVSSACDTLRDSVQVLQASFPLSVQINASPEVKQGEAVQLTFTTNATQWTSVNWSAPADANIDCDTCIRINSRPLQATTYRVVLQDANGCIAEDTFRVEVDADRGIFTPNVFSPNQDGIADHFYLSGTTARNFRNLMVWDRWGNKVFERSEGILGQPQHGWDGTRNASQVDPGVYYWNIVIIYPDGATEQRKGYVTLMR